MHLSYQFLQSFFSLTLQINHDHEEMSYGNQFFITIDEHKGGAVMEAPKSVQSEIALHYSTD